MSKPKHSGNQDQGYKQQPRPGWLKENAPLIFDAILAIVALVGTPFLWVQLRMTREQLALTREQVHAGQRAYVMAHAAALKNPLAVGQPTHVNIDLTNYGETPALDVAYTACLSILPSLTDSLTCDLPERPAIALGAGQKIVVFAVRLNPLKADELQEITEEDVALTENTFSFTERPKLILYGHVRYRDVFGGSGETEFCNAYYKRADSFVGCPSHHAVK